MESRLLPGTWCRAHHGRLLSRTLSVAAYAAIALGLAAQGVIAPRVPDQREVPKAGVRLPVRWIWDLETEDGTFPAKYEPLIPNSVPALNVGAIFEA